MSRQMGFHHDVRRCTGCRSCLMACRNENRLEPGLQWREVYAYRGDATVPGRHYLSVSCNHCQQPECLRVCPNGAFTKRHDGVVAQDPARCNGCRLCTLACPSGAPRYSLRHRRTSKCGFCTDRQAEGLPPSCVAACPTGALSIIDLATFSGPGAVAVVPGLPNSGVTTPSVRFTIPDARTAARREIRAISDAPLESLRTGQPLRSAD